MSHYYDKLRTINNLEAAKADNMLGQIRYAKIDTYDPETYRVRCYLVPEKTDKGDRILTGWLQIATPWVGPNYGELTPFAIDDTVVLLPIHNSDTEYVVVCGLYNVDVPPAKGPNDIGGGDEVVEIGEKLLRSKDGTTVKFVNGNTLMIKTENEKHESVHIITKGTDVSIQTDAFVNVSCDTASVYAKTSITGYADGQITLSAPQITLNGEVQINGNLTVSEEVSDYGASMGEMRDLYDVHIHGDSSPPTPLMPG